MLILSRKKDQKILIGNQIVVQVCQIKGSTVRVGIDAPADVEILRGELESWLNPPINGQEAQNQTTWPIADAHHPQPD